MEYDYTSPDPPLKPKKYCAEYQQIAHDRLNVSHVYFLWRTLNGERYLESGGRSTKGQSIDAVTATVALPDPTAITGNAPGYWTSGINDPSSQGAEPAWIFNIGDNTVCAVDAFTGQYLGTITQ